MPCCGAAVCIEQEERAAGAAVCVVVVGQGSQRRCTFTSTLDLSAAEQGVVEEIGQATVEVD